MATDGRPFRYLRIVQLASGPTDIWDAELNYDPIFTEHCEKVLSLRQRNSQCSSSIKTSNIFLHNSNLFLIDGRIALLELATSEPSGGRRIRGDLIFYDFQGLLTQPLIEIFNRIDVLSTTITNIRHPAAPGGTAAS